MYDDDDSGKGEGRLELGEHFDDGDHDGDDYGNDDDDARKTKEGWSVVRWEGNI